MMIPTLQRFYFTIIYFLFFIYTMTLILSLLVEDHHSSHNGSIVYILALVPSLVYLD